MNCSRLQGHSELGDHRVSPIGWATAPHSAHHPGVMYMLESLAKAQTPWRVSAARLVKKPRAVTSPCSHQRGGSGYDRFHTPSTMGVSRLPLHCRDEALKKSGAISPCRGRLAPDLLVVDSLAGVTILRETLAGTLAQAGQVQNDNCCLCLQADPAARNELGKALFTVSRDA